MIETIEQLIIFNISEYEENDAIINCIKENGDHILLRARGFFKENSRNILKFKQMSIIMTEYFKNNNLDYQNWGLLKTGDLIFELDIKDENSIFFKDFIWNIINQNYLSIKKNSFNLIKNILELKNSGLYENKYLFFYFLKINLNFLKINFSLKCCSICKSNKNIKSFSIFENGLICKNCFDERKHFLFNIEELKFLIFFFSIKNIKDLNKLVFNYENEKIIAEMFKSYYENELGYKITIF